MDNKRIEILEQFIEEIIFLDKDKNLSVEETYYKIVKMAQDLIKDRGGKNE